MPWPACPAVENYPYDWTALTKPAIDPVARALPRRASAFDPALSGKTMQIATDRCVTGAGGVNPTNRFLASNQLSLRTAARRSELAL